MRILYAGCFAQAGLARTCNRRFCVGCIFRQRTGKLTGGIVKDILMTSAFHSRGIKVRLTTGEVGRVQEIVEAGHGAAREGRG